jgi:diacylglycerol O-acyltransferase / wax synthase
MARLTTLDASFLKAPPDRSLTIGAVAVVDGAVPDYDLLKKLLAERIQTIPRCTQVLRAEWIDDPGSGFDLTHHVRRVALPRPGDDTELFRAIAHALERPLDLDRPLWECWVIEGLKGKQWAILMKVHHCLADRISAAQLLSRLCDDADSDTFANHVGAKQVSPSQRAGPGRLSLMRCPDCHKMIGRFDAVNPPRCPRTGRVVVLPTTRWRDTELVWGWWRPVNADG